MVYTRVESNLWKLTLVLISGLVALEVEGFNVEITYIQSAVAKGAVCLDGSAPAYHFSEGYGEGINNWLVHFEGGGWCNSAKSCLSRRDTHRGSSKHMTKQMGFSGILHNRSRFNPDFYNWNRIKVRYCDGSSFTGDIEAVDPVTKLYYRGARVWLAVIEDLLAKGMKNAKNAILSGCSAGGLASILHCDKFSELLPPTAKVKCLSDAGFFINEKDVSGGAHIKKLFGQVVTTHHSEKNLPVSCTSKLKPASMCFFPQYVASQMKTPLFILNAAYDTWQIKNILAPGAADPQGTWRDCKLDISKCSGEQLNIMHKYRLGFLKAIAELGNSTTRGLFILSCYAHCHSGTQKTWLREDSPVLNGTPIATAIGDWYYERRTVQKIDCPYPCNKSCHNRIFDQMNILEDNYSYIRVSQ